MRMHVARAILLSLLVTSLSLADDGEMTLELRGLRVSSESVVSVQMYNASSQPIKIWRESNSWGAARWRVLRIRDGQLAAMHQRIVEEFTRNVPSFVEIAPSASLDVTLDLAQPRWGPSSTPRLDFKAGDMVIVVYDVAFSMEGQRLGVWESFTSAMIQHARATLETTP